MPTSAPPRPTLDLGRAEACRLRLAAVLRTFLATLAGAGDRQAAAGCRLLAWMLADVGRATRARSAAAIEGHVGEVERLAAALPGRLAELSKPAEFDPADREACRPVFPKRKQWGRG